MSAILNLASRRIRLLRRAVVEAVDARELLAPHNEAMDTKEANEEDIVIYEPAPTSSKGKR